MACDQIISEVNWLTFNSNFVQTISCTLAIKKFKHKYSQLLLNRISRTQAKTSNLQRILVKGKVIASLVLGKLDFELSRLEKPGCLICINIQNPFILYLVTYNNIKQVSNHVDTLLYMYVQIKKIYKENEEQTYFFFLVE